MIKIQNFNISKGNRVLLRDISLKIEANEKVLLKAENGMGKSSLIRCICGLENPISGNVRFYRNNKPVKRNVLTVSYLPETFEIDESLFVKQLISAFRLAYKVNNTLSSPLFLNNLYSDLKIKDLESQQFGSLSKGEKKRLMIYTCLLPDFDILLLDEPYSGLDTAWRKCISDLITLQFNDGKKQRIVIISSHVHNKTTDLDFTRKLTIKNNSLVAV